MWCVFSLPGSEWRHCEKVLPPAPGEWVSVLHCFFFLLLFPVFLTGSAAVVGVGSVSTYAHLLVCVLPCAQCMVKLVHLLNSPCPPFEGEGVILVVVKCTSLAQKCVLLKMMILTAAEGRRRYLNGEEKKKKKRKKKIKTFPTLSVPYFLLCVCLCT